MSTPAATGVTAKQRALFELLIASSIWGFGFVATVWALPGIGPIWLTSLRFVMAIGMLDLMFRSRIAGLKPLKYSFSAFLSVFWPGLFLFALLTFQTWGLKFTSATKSGFITVLYVLLVPFLERIFLKRRISPLVWLWIALAILGTSMICGAVTSSGVSPDFLGSFNVGDGLTFLCAISAAAHLIFVNHHLQGGQFDDSPVTFHIYQSLWTVLFAAVAGFFVEGMDWVSVFWSGGWDWKIWVGVLHLGLISSGIAFLIQVRAQRFVAPTTVGLMVLLESPWAMVFSILLLGEILSGLQLLGAGLILIAAVAECIQQAQKD